MDSKKALSSVMDTLESLSVGIMEQSSTTKQRERKTQKQLDQFQKQLETRDKECQELERELKKERESCLKLVAQLEQANRDLAIENRRLVQSIRQMVSAQKQNRTQLDCLKQEISEKEQKCAELGRSLASARINRPKARSESNLNEIKRISDSAKEKTRTITAESQIVTLQMALLAAETRIRNFDEENDKNVKKSEQKIQKILNLSKVIIQFLLGTNLTYQESVLKDLNLYFPEYVVPFFEHAVKNNVIIPQIALESLKKDELLYSIVCLFNTENESCDLDNLEKLSKIKKNKQRLVSLGAARKLVYMIKNPIVCAILNNIIESNDVFDEFQKQLNLDVFEMELCSFSEHGIIYTREGNLFSPTFDEKYMFEATELSLQIILRMKPTPQIMEQCAKIIGLCGTSSHDERFQNFLNNVERVLL